MGTKEKLLISGLKLYAKKGLNGVTLDDILEDSNVQKGSFYHFFKNKDQLLEESLQKYFMPIVQMRDDKLKNSVLPFRELVESFYLDMPIELESMLYDMIGENNIRPNDIGILMLETMRTRKYSSASFYTNQGRIRDILIEKIVKEQLEGRLPGNISSSDIATLIVTCGEGALYLSTWNTGLYSNADTLKICFRHLWNYLDHADSIANV